MEGPQHLKPKPYQLNQKEQITLVTIIILFHIVGLAGLLTPALRPLFLTLVPWHIVLMLVVIIASHRPIDEKFILFTLIIFSTGFTGEWMGVSKSWVFGNYSYGTTLGLRLFNIPLTMGINWFLLIYSTGVLMQRLRVKSIYIRITAGALLLVLLDLLIEPVALKLGYWHWANNAVPFTNYLGWFLVSVIMLFIFERFNFKKQSLVGPVLLVIQFVFFALLAIF